MRIRTLVSLGAAALLVTFLLPGTSLAGDFGRFGPYLGVNAAYGINLAESRAEEVLPGPVSSENSPGLNARLGLRLFSWLAVEAQYEWMDSLETKFGGGGAFETKSHVVTANAKILLPVWRLHPYLLVGVGGNFYDLNIAGVGSQSGTAFAGRVGGGLDLYITDSILLNAEVAGLLSAEDLDVAGATFSPLHYLSVSAGLQYRF